MQCIYNTIALGYGINEIGIEHVRRISPLSCFVSSQENGQILNVTSALSYETRNQQTAIESKIEANNFPVPVALSL
jgi:hypothetical protein